MKYKLDGDIIFIVSTVWMVSAIFFLILIRGAWLQDQEQLRIDRSCGYIAFSGKNTVQVLTRGDYMKAVSNLSRYEKNDSEIWKKAVSFDINCSLKDVLKWAQQQNYPDRPVTIENSEINSF
jgi:hypothetical protein